MALKTHAVRVSEANRLALIAIGLRYVVYRAKDVGVTVPGHIESAFTIAKDAELECKRLCAAYAGIDADGFAIADLRETH